MLNNIYKKIDDEKEMIIEISHGIHSRPEIGFEEYESSKLLADYLFKLGYDVTLGIEDLETAFLAKIGSGRPRVAILAEYDALPNIGHGCGHNVIAAVACGVATGFSKEHFQGTLYVIGTPAEENAGGKIELINRGIFDDIDYAMMVHPSSVNMVQRGGTSLVELKIEYHGQRAHSSAPEAGVNALNALIQTFNGIDALYREFPIGINVNGIITSGGEASNIIPGFSSGEFIIRGQRLLDLKTVKVKIESIIESVEKLTGAKAGYEFALPYAERYPNALMGQVFKDALEALDEKVLYPEKNVKLGSSDIGNVSLKIPVIHPYIKIGDDLKAHTLMFTEASKSPQADHMIIKASKALSSVAHRLLTDKDFQKQVDQAFMTQVPDYKDFSF